MRRFLLLLVILAIIVVFSATIWILSGLSPPDQAGRRVRFKVQPNLEAAQIAQALKKEGLIRNPAAFCLVSRLRRLDRKLESGTYLLNTSMSGFEIISCLAEGKGRLKDVMVTIPEGYTLAQIAKLLEDKGVVSSKAFLSAATGSAIPAGLVSFPLPSGSLEGYLFPDTYNFFPDTNPHSVVRKMLTNFEKKIYQPFGSELQACSLSLPQAITLASMVEREAQLPSERPLIAKVYLNRLARNWRLECDATVQYALGQHKPRLSRKDTKIKSPYNTYQHKGLPPGPICNPGADSIRAVLEPANVPYLYYVAKGDGSHIFSETLAKHRAAGG